DQQRQVFIRVKTLGTHTLKGRLVPADIFIADTSEMILFNGGYLALALVCCIINLVAAVRLRDKVYGYYGLYLFTVFTEELGMGGLHNLLWPSLVHHTSDFVVSGGIGLGFALFNLFYLRMFNIKSRYPWVYRYLMSVVLLGVVTTLASGTRWYGVLAPLLMANGVFQNMVLLFVAYRMRQYGAQVANLFLMAFLPLLVGTAVIFLRTLGFLPLNWITFHSYQVGSALHMLLMTLALSERVRSAEYGLLLAVQDTERRATTLAEERTIELCRKQCQLEQSLVVERDALAEQGRFIDMVSHEYRTPLSIIQANLDILGLGILEEGQKASSLFRMSHAVQRLQEIFDNYLQQNELERKLVLKREILNIVAFVWEVVA
ncbi:sensor histidine kinase, partial [bacterium]|nr:sensor histidine kinase [bacterium]